MKRKYIGLVFISMFTFAAMFAATTPGKAAAAAPEGCGLLAPVNAADNDPNCLHQTYNTGGLTTCTLGDIYGTDTCESAGSSQATLKSNFINNMQWFQTHGQPYQKISAAWIEQKLGGSDWAARINEPAVTLTFAANYPFTENSEYIPQSNTTGYVYYPYAEASTARWAIVIKVNGVVYDTIKLDCGNLVNGSSTLPNPTTTIQGHVWNWTTGADYADVKIETCLASEPYVYTDAAGDYSITNVPTGSSVCAQVAGGGPAGMLGPYVRPLGNSYGYSCPGPTPTSPGFGASKTSPLVDGKNYCPGDSGYLNQVAGIYSDNNYDRNQDSGYDIVYVNPPPVPTCGFINVNPSQLDPATPYTVSATVDYQTADQAATVKNSDDQLFIDITGPSVNYNNANVGMTQSGASVTGQVSPGATHNTGTYTVKYGITGSQGPISCTGSFVVTDQPTTTTTGGDTGSGMGMNVGGVDCAVPADPLASLVGWNNDGKPDYAGAGSGYAALVLNHLQDYASAQSNTSLEPSGLSFANTADGDVNLGSGLFGGNFGGSSCTRDYFAGATNVQTGNVTINGQAVANGAQTTMYVKGNVYITGNITFSGSYAKVSDIPAFDVIVEGNIYIAPTVSELDGLFVAEPTVSGGSTTGGVIYTCASAPFTAAALNANLYSTCNQSSLSVNGAFVAQQVWMLRTTGTLKSGNPAESVNYSPEIWLNTPPSTGSGSGDTYDAITSLPPVL